VRFAEEAKASVAFERPPEAASTAAQGAHEERQRRVDRAGRLAKPRPSFSEATSILPALLKGPNTVLIHGPPPHAQRRLDASTIADLVGRRGSGVTIEALADEFGIHRTTVMAFLRRAGA
jgi:hypothetical protein